MVSLLWDGIKIRIRTQSVPIIFPEIWELSRNEIQLSKQKRRLQWNQSKGETKQGEATTKQSKQREATQKRSRWRSETRYYVRTSSVKRKRTRSEARLKGNRSESEATQKAEWLQSQSEERQGRRRIRHLVDEYKNHIGKQRRNIDKSKEQQKKIHKESMCKAINATLKRAALPVPCRVRFSSVADCM